MKNFLKVSSLALMLGFAGSAVAAVGSDQALGTFQWVGTIPADNQEGVNAKIVNTGTVDHQRGALTFVKNSSAGYDLTSSSELIFDVHTSTAATPTTWTPATSYTYKVQTLQFGTGGAVLSSVSPTTPEFHIKANGLALPAAGNSNANGNQKLTVGADAPLTAAGFVSGAAVVVQATIFVSSAV